MNELIDHKIFLVRHGISEGNVNKKKYYEKRDCDIELTDDGRLQAEGLAEYIMNDKHVSNGFSVYASPYKRAKDTANYFIHGLPEHEEVSYREDPRLREREWGELRDIVEEGKKTEDHFNFFYRPLGGESFADLYDRVAGFDAWLKSQTTYKNIVIFSHGEWIKTYMMYKLGWTIQDFDRYKCPRNCEVMTIQFSQGEYVLDQRSTGKLRMRKSKDDHFVG